jgi:hypothetical protein
MTVSVQVDVKMPHELLRLAPCRENLRYLCKPDLMVINDQPGCSTILTIATTHDGRALRRATAEPSGMESYSLCFRALARFEQHENTPCHSFAGPVMHDSVILRTAWTLDACMCCCIRPCLEPVQIERTLGSTSPTSPTIAVPRGVCAALLRLGTLDRTASPCKSSLRSLPSFRVLPASCHCTAPCWAFALLYLSQCN